MPSGASSQLVEPPNSGFYIAGALLVVITIVSVVCNFAFPDLIPINGGFGWDGYFFVPIFYDFPRFFFKHGIDAYHIQRILPVAITYYALHLCHIEITQSSIVHFMQWYQCLLRVASVVVWLLISRTMKFRWDVMVVGFLALFVNFATLKYSIYDPVTTDSTALFLSLLSCLFYLRNQLIPLTLSAVAALAVWPTTIACMLPLILFPRHHVIEWKGNRNSISKAIAVVCSFAFAICSCYAYAALRKMPYEMIQPIAWLLPVSIPAASAILGFVIYTMTAHMPFATKAVVSRLKTIQVGRWLAAAVLMFAYIKLRKLSSGEWNNTSVEGYLYFVSASTRPLQFLIVHALYFGPLMLTLYALFRPFCREVQRLGMGAYILVAEALLLCVNSESRKLINMMPFIVLALCMVLSRKPLRKRFIICATLFSVLISKVWLPINWTVASLNLELDKLFQHGSFESVGSQLFFAHFGPSASNQSLLISAVMLLAMFPLMQPFAKAVKGSADVGDAGPAPGKIEPVLQEKELVTA